MRSKYRTQSERVGSGTFEQEGYGGGVDALTEKLRNSCRRRSKPEAVLQSGASNGCLKNQKEGLVQL